MTERTITALYDTRGAAESGARRPGRARRPEPPGCHPRHRGRRLGRDADHAATEDEGFWASLADLFMPDEDRYTYAEGVRRGGYLLTAQVPDGLEDQALDVLERSDPVDLDQRAESWRQEGWTGYQAGATSTDAGAATAGRRSPVPASCAGPTSAPGARARPPPRTPPARR